MPPLYWKLISADFIEADGGVRFRSITTQFILGARSSAGNYILTITHSDVVSHHRLPDQVISIRVNALK